MDFFFKHEYKAFVQYLPNVKRIMENKVNMVAAIGRDSDDAHYVQSTRVLASRLHCKCIEYPGQHDVSFYMPQELANSIRSTLERWRGRKNDGKNSEQMADSSSLFHSRDKWHLTKDNAIISEQSRARIVYSCCRFSTVWSSSAGLLILYFMYKFSWVFINLFFALL